MFAGCQPVNTIYIKVDFYTFASSFKFFIIFLVREMFKIFGKRMRYYLNSIPLASQARKCTNFCDNELKLLF